MEDPGISPKTSELSNKDDENEEFPSSQNSNFSDLSDDDIPTIIDPRNKLDSYSTQKSDEIISEIESMEGEFTENTLQV